MNEQASTWLSAVKALPEVHTRLQRVVILHRPALEVIRTEDSAKTMVYVDPPYLHETRTATDVYGDYEMTAADHEELLQTLLKVKGKVMLSGYGCDLYDVTLKAWNRRAFELPYNSAGGETRRRMVEVVWCNF